MNLEWSGQERITASKEKVWSFINDPTSIASCLPDVRQTNVLDAHTFDATVGVAVGPVRGSFKFKIALEPRPDGNHMDMKINGGGLGSVIDLLAAADLTAEGDAATILNWKGTASMRGPIATVGGRVLDTQALRVIRTTFENVRNRLSGNPPSQ
ncbi:MAG: carbon monoxide dehydrogenase subunit G [Candidatus Cybelea sp.]|jgi:carbon monoxide dehydrogenase subunit G